MPHDIIEKMNISSINFFNKLEKFLLREKMKKNLILLQILKSREKASISIQKYFRRFLQRKEILNYFDKKKNFYEIPFSAILDEENSEIYLVILFPDQFKNRYLLQYCKLRNLYVAHLPKDKFNIKNCHNNIYFKFRVNGKDCIDPNYEIISNFRKGKFYNKLDLNDYENLEKNFKLHLRKKTCEYMNWKCENFHNKINIKKRPGSRSWSKKKKGSLKISKERSKLTKGNNNEIENNLHTKSLFFKANQKNYKLDKEEGCNVTYSTYGNENIINFSPIFKFKFYSDESLVNKESF